MTLRMIYNEPVTVSGGIRLAEDETHFYDCMPMFFNDRLCMTPKSNPYVWEYGWCFKKLAGAAVMAALAVWDPETQDEPVGWHKRPTDRVRRAPRRDEAPEYNRDRCVHGCYMDAPCTVDDYCNLMRPRQHHA